MKADRDRVEKVVLRTSKIMDYKGPSDHLHVERKDRGECLLLMPLQ